MRTLIIPGLNGSESGHWQWYWQKDNAGSRIISQEDWSRPNLDCWVANVVAHSLGCLAVAKLAARNSASLIKGALLVAPCDPKITDDLHPGAISFGRLNEKQLPFPNILVGSLNDHYMPIDKLTDLGEQWQANVLNLGMAGHINIASGYGRWTTGYSLMDTLVNRAKAQKRKFPAVPFPEPEIQRC